MLFFFDLPAEPSEQRELGKANRRLAGLRVRNSAVGYFVFSELALTTRDSGEFRAGSPSALSGGCVVTMLTRADRFSTSHGTIPYTQACFMLLREDDDIRGPEEKMRSNRAQRKHELLSREVTRTGNLLLDALALERELRQLYERKPSGEGLRKWRNFRRALDFLVEDYVRAVARYRRTVKSIFLREVLRKRP